MGIITIAILAIGLSFDSFAVSVSSGLVLKGIDYKNAMKIAFSLALFQGGMPVIGWYFGSEIKDYVVEIDHLIAFILLTLIGGKMIFESLKKNKEDKTFNPLKLSVLIGISIATSIDALIIGISFAFLKISILLAAITIGVITFFISMSGILFGKKTGKRFGKKMEILGGLILIFIGLKIFIEHQFFQ